MRFRQRLPFAVILLALTASSAYALLTVCNISFGITNGGYSQYLSGTGVGYCFQGIPTTSLKCRVEVWVDGMGVSPTCPQGVRYGNACAMQSANFSTNTVTVNAQADYNRGTGVYSFGCFTSKGNGWWIGTDGAYHAANGGNPRSTTSCIPEPPHHNPVLCLPDGPYWCGGSPILIPTDPSGSGLRLSEPEVTFDLEGDGAAELVSWPVDPDTVAFLAYDKNGNGFVDDGSELLGNHFDPDAGNGFDAINRLLVQAGQERAGSIEESNPVFAGLILWNDRNRNGVSDAGELRPASDVLHRIGLGFWGSPRVDAHDNEYRWEGWAEFKNPSGNVAQKPIYDVYLNTSAQ
jgi:hypothetical protein